MIRPLFDLSGDEIDTDEVDEAASLTALATSSASGADGKVVRLASYDPSSFAHARMTPAEARSVLVEARRSGLVLEGRCPVAFGVAVDPLIGREQMLIGEATHIVYMVDPVVRAVAVAGGGRQRGRRTFSFGLGTESANPAGIAAFLAAINPMCFANKDDIATYVRDLYGSSRYGTRRAVGVIGVLGSNTVSDAALRRAYPHPSASLSAGSWTYPGEGASLISGPESKVVAAAPSGTYVELWINAGQLFARVGVDLTSGCFKSESVLPRPDGDPFSPKTYRVRDAAELLAAAAACGWNVVSLDGDDTADKVARLAEVVSVVSVKPGRLGTLVVDEGPLWSEQREISVAGGAKDIAAMGGLVGVEPEAADLAAMGAASPIEMSGLRDYQARFVGVFEATDYGIVNACRVGLGKTICALAGMRVRAESDDGYRALVVAPADKRSDWCDEGGKWFPEATILPVYNTKGLGKALAVMDGEGGGPVVLVVSYDLALSGVDELAKRRIDDVVIDEGNVLWNPNSKTSKALWRLREVAGRASVLTGTPYSRTLDQMAQLVAYARGDATLAKSLNLGGLSEHLYRAEEQGELLQRIGPVVFREDRGVVAAELPTVTPEVVHIEAHPAEVALAHAARDELRRLYEALVERVETAAALDPDDPKLAAARTELIAARGRMLGGITLARLATSEPAALKHSDAAGAVLLREAGYVDAAIRVGSTKRRILTESLQEVVADGGAALVFTDFAQVAESYAAAFSSEGMRVGLLTGSVGVRRREAICAAYNGGDLDVVVLGSVGKRGLNLQTRTNVLVHADMPWTPDVLLQRVGRADRLGAGARELSEWLPIVSDTIEERVAAVVMARGGLLVALDAARGRIDHSDTATMMRALALEVDEAEAGGYAGMLGVAKAVLGV